MADKGYYYLKLKDNFFDTDEMKILESMENGYLYSNILLKLYLKALRNDGKLTFNEYIPYDIKMLATIVGHNVDVVEKAIKIFQQMHLIEILDNGTIYMLDMQKMIGSISNEGVRKAEYRERIKLEKEKRTQLGQCPDIISISISNSNSNNLDLYKSILTYLNDKVGTHYKPVESNIKFIKARLKDYTEEDLKTVIDKKVAEWKGTDMEKYLRPETLFNATKFESYLNQQAKSSGFIKNQYTKEQINGLITDLDDVEV